MSDEAATFGNQYLRALAVQGRVIGALILRETRTRFWKNRLGYLWALIEPIMHIAIWFVILFVLSANPFADHTRTILLLSTGMLPYLAFRNVASFIETAIKSNLPLLNYPIVRHLDLMFARFLLEAATMIVVSIIVIAGLVFFGFSEMPDDIPALGMALAYALALGLGFGMCNAVLANQSLMYKRVLDIVMRLLYFCSGVMYPVEKLPEDFKIWLTWNPVLHVVELFRSAYFPLYESSFKSVSYVLIWALVLGLTGAIGARIAGARLNQP